MDAGLSPRQTRAKHRHELRTLTYVTLDQANGGIVRNLSHSGIGMQAVAAVRPRQQLRVRFELRYPRLQVETRAEVVWSTFSGQCGIRFLEMPAALKRQVGEWILGDLLERISLHSEHSGSMFARSSRAALHDDNGNGNGAVSPGIEDRPNEDKQNGDADEGLMVSAMPIKAIALPMRRDPPPQPIEKMMDESPPASNGFEWLSQLLSGRTLAWTVDAMVVVAALLLFTLVFLSVTRESPPWPLSMVCAAALVMAGMYWGFVRVSGGGSLGARLARIAESERQEPER